MRERERLRRKTHLYIAYQQLAARVGQSPVAERLRRVAAEERRGMREQVITCCDCVRATVEDKETHRLSSAQSQLLLYFLYSPGTYLHIEEESGCRQQQQRQ
jgi:hypothetical protein